MWNGDALELKNQIGSAVDGKRARAVGNAEAGGGAKAAEAQRAKGRLTVRERLALLLDEGRSCWSWGCGRRMGCMRSMAARRGGGGDGAGTGERGGCA
jgi:acetyl-CoA carboxylase carboxyltransferase component